MFETEAENRIRTIFKTETTEDRPLDVETESLADLWLRLRLVFGNKPF